MSLFKLISLIIVITIKFGFSVDVPIETFDLSKYSQNIDHYISSSDQNYNKPILTKKHQNALLQELISHSIGNKSPWSKSFFDKYTQKVFYPNKSNNIFKYLVPI